jgi:uncharacterized protein (TIGR00369 family)
MADHGSSEVSTVPALPPYFIHVGIAAAGGNGDATLTFRDEITNSAGFVHGGAISALLNFAMLQALHAARPGMRCALVTITVSYLAPAKGAVTGSATVERAGRNIAYLSAKATAASGLVATATAVFQLNSAAPVAQNSAPAGERGRS